MDTSPAKNGEVAPSAPEALISELGERDEAIAAGKALEDCGYFAPGQHGREGLGPTRAHELERLDADLEGKFASHHEAIWPPFCLNVKPI